MCYYFSKLSLLFLFAFLINRPVPVTSAIEPIRLSSSDETEVGDLCKLLDSSSFKNLLERILQDARNEEERNSQGLLKVSFVSVEEARGCFEEYFSSILTQEEKEKGLLDKILSHRYFGENSSPFVTLQERDKIFKTDIEFLFSMAIALRTGNPMGLMEAKKAWSPITVALLDPKKALEISRTALFSHLLREAPDSLLNEIFSENYFSPLSFSSDFDLDTYFRSSDLGKFSGALIFSIYESAKEIMKKSKKGDIIVIFGNTPYFVGKALKHIISPDVEDSNYREIIEFPFSGHPNRISGRNENLQFSGQDLVTLGRLAHLKERMKNAGLSSSNQRLLTSTTYFIDVIETAGGLSYVIELLLKDFLSQGEALPNLNIIKLNPEFSPFVLKEKANREGYVKFYFPSVKAPHFLIDGFEMILSEIEVLDDAPAEMRGFPKYNAMYWQKEYDQRLVRPGDDLISLLDHYFDTHIKALKEKDSQDLENIGYRMQQCSIQDK